MELPQLSEVQFQASAQSKAFDPLQLPDPNPQLSQNLSIIQQSFSNLAQSGRINAAADYTSDPTFMEQFAELLPKAMETAIQVQNVDVAIQMARADDQYYQMLNQGLIKPSEELQNVIKNEKTKDLVIKTAAAEAAAISESYDVPRGILGFSNHGEIALRRRVAQHMFQNVYPEWMNTQLATNATEVMVSDGKGGMTSVAINAPDLPDFQHKEIMSHLRTAFLGHELLANTNNDLIQKEMAIGFSTDAKISREYSRTTRANDGNKRFTAAYTNMLNEFNEGNLNSLAEAMVESASIYDKDGKTLLNSPEKFFNRLISDIGTAAENGAEFSNIGEFIMKAKTADGKTFMERAPKKARMLMRTYREKRRTYLNNKQKADKQDLIFAIAEFNKRSLEEPQSVSDFVAFKKIVSQRALEIGIPDSDLLTQIDRGMAIASYGADEINQLREAAEIALATGNASQSADYYLHPVVGPEVREKVDRQVERLKTPEYKVNSEEISSTIGQAVKGTMVDPLGRLKGQAVQVNAYYQRIYDAKYAQLLEENRTAPEGSKLTPQAIADQARDAALSQWEKDQKDTKAKYYVDPKNGTFPNFPKYKADASEAALQANVATLTNKSKTGKGILNEVAANPQLVMREDDVRAAITNFQQSGTISPALIRASKEINNAVGKIVITNPMNLAIAAAQGYGILKPGEVVQAPEFIRSAATDEKKRQWMRELVGLEGEVYTNPAKYGPTSNMSVRSVFQGTVAAGLPGVRGLGSLVRSGEGGYTSMFPSENYPELTNMVISTELVAFQKAKLRDGRASAAVGAYQFLYPERAAKLAGLPPDAKFTPENQEKMFMATLLNKPDRQAISQYLQGKSDNIELAIDQMAMEFASIEYRNGRTYYQDGVNKASISRDRVRIALMSARKEILKGRD